MIYREVYYSTCFKFKVTLTLFTLKLLYMYTLYKDTYYKFDITKTQNLQFRIEEVS